MTLRPSLPHTLAFLGCSTLQLPMGKGGSLSGCQPTSPYRDLGGLALPCIFLPIISPSGANCTTWMLPTEHSFLEKLARSLQNTDVGEKEIPSSIYLGTAEFTGMKPVSLLLIFQGLHIGLWSLWVSKKTGRAAIGPKPF